MGISVCTGDYKESERSLSTFHLKVVSLRQVLCDSEVQSVFVTGTEGEYELLPFHHELMGALGPGEIKIVGHDAIPLRAGVAMFKNNVCTIIIEEQTDERSTTSS